MILLLPRDLELISYLNDYGRELDIITGENSLVILLGNSNYKRVGLDKRIRKLANEAAWRKAVREHAWQGYSADIAHAIGMRLDSLPCLLMFKDIRSPNRVVVPLGGMIAAEIGHLMRTLFSLVDEAVTNKKDPLRLIRSHLRRKTLLRRGKAVVSAAGGIAETTFEVAIGALIRAVTGA
jgi:hypothetical protein